MKSYVNYSSTSSKKNSQVISTKDGEIYFSYRTPVAFDGKKGLVIRENDWRQTTGKHLNAISRNKDIRISEILVEVEVDVVY